MARLPRMSAPGLPHLVVQLGHNGVPLFPEPADRRTYRQALAQAARAGAVDVHAYALAERRVLLLVTPHEDGALSHLMQRIGQQYTAAFNRRHGRTGTLWEGRFRAAVVEPGGWLLGAMRHVEASALATDDGEPATSALHHRGQLVEPLITDPPAFWALGNTPFERQAAYVLLSQQPLDADTGNRLEHAMLHGWAIGSDRFLAELAARLARPVRPRRPGRPRSPGPAVAASADEPG